MTDETVIAPGPFSRITPGYRLNEIYEIDSLLATGGMGEVYRGHAIETGDEVAIKTIRPEFAQNAAALALFKREASALRNLYHEAIVRYFVFSIDRGLPYLAMEFVEGKSLSEFLQKGPLNLEQLRVLQKRLASGLQAAHELGIIHRDVSPDNIILPGENLARAKIIDFGIARSGQGEGTVIGSGFAGKFSYVSPEQLGLFGGNVTAQSDIYSLGLVLAEAALGKAIDMGHSHVDVIEKRRRVPDLTGVDPRFRPLLQRMLQPNPKDRPASMSEVVEWAPSGGRRGARGMKGLAIAAGVLLLLGGLGGAGYLLAPQLRQLVPGGGGAPAAMSGPGERMAGLPSASDASPGRSAEPAPPPDGGEALLPQAPPPRTEPQPEPPAEIANLPPAAAPAPPPPEMPRAAGPASPDQVASFLRDYTGGDCFFVAPIAIAAREARIEAFGASPTPFVEFDTAFQRNLGFEPEIGLRQVTSAQCPAVEFLARKATQRGSRAPRLTIQSDRLRSGQELRGSVDGKADANVELLLVADDGLVHSLGPFAKRSGDAINFSLRLEASSAGEKPQLVIAIASPRPLPSLKLSGPANADRFFRQLQDETSRGQVSGVATRYFKLGG
ncbi:serine/threonine-protein kinase [Enterovirga aerilata]|uniref:Serine/threonine protein kinase n=1 Tax=Enterovirga aerilata TaxID=2730920 RepID=A0A849I485_9HYPH|nr:serine/threonine-protein kinase [Enterovirga sp. DB1703]NNM74646.1 serine/threonine protein kinase [Enterovirga sp. DB1703]